MHKIDIGDVFGDLVVLDVFSNTKKCGNKYRAAKCRCVVCGATGHTDVWKLVKNKVKSCKGYKRRVEDFTNYSVAYTHNLEKVFVSKEDKDILEVSSLHTDEAGYFITKLNSKNKRIHLIISERIYGEFEIIDHKDRDKSNCRRNNLRRSTRKQNNRNMPLKKMKTKTSKYKGVYYSKETINKWQSSITVDGEKILLGRYDSEMQAAIVYDEYALIYHKEFACTNTMLGLL